jgi:pyruvate/2-oxoglutarate dehydrogenase complex dihydrolipoamide dehydrogenase (E3) component/uncharacterized membrane protein YdjX (TVP38/TMEM64 family)
MKKTLRILLVLVLVAGVAAFRHYHLGSYLELDALKANQAILQGWVQRSPALAGAIYLLAYVVVTAASLPGAAILTLAGGALFGLIAGTVLVSFASTLGATCAFLLARFVLRDYVTHKFRGSLERINQGIAREGAFYLFTLRLIPIFPFFAINAVMGLTRMPVRTFFFVSQAGMLLGTIAYVNAGTQLARITSLRGILSPSVLLSFVFLGLLPFIAKRIVGALQARKTLGRYRRPKRYDYNVIVIGAGSAGLVSAYIAATVRAKVALIEKHKMGGDCLNTGCVPSKALIRTAKVLAERARAADLGLRKIDITFEFAEVMERVQKVIREIEPHDSVDRYSKLGVECIAGTARIRSPYEVEVEGKTLTARNLILATGASPLVPALPGIEKVGAWTSDTIWKLRVLPKRMVVLGGGPIGCELAQCFARFGTKVTQVEKGPRILPREDADVAALVSERFAREGIEILAGHAAKEFGVENGRKFLNCDQGGKAVRLEFDEVLLALGRKPNVTGFGLEELGVTISDRGTIATDDFLRTNFPNLFVCGDVAGPYQFTHTAAHQAWFAAVNALFGPYKMFRADYRVIPWSTFTDPEVARVGLSEQEAKERGIAYEVTRYGIDDLDRAIADGEAHGMVKVLTEPGRDRILGVAIAGSHAGDIIVEYVAAMKHGIGLNKILGTIHIYPTLGEANKYAAGNWKKAHAPAGVLKRLEKFHAWRRNQARLPI